jgi:hypothetical protein
MDTARDLHILEMIHTILKSSQKVETKALNLFKHQQNKGSQLVQASAVKITCQRSDEIEIMMRSLIMWIKDLYQHPLVSSALIQEKVTSIY